MSAPVTPDAPNASSGTAHAAPQQAFVADRDLFIDNQWRPSADGGSFSLVNPATEESFGRAAAGTPQDVDAAVGAARAAFDHGPWPRLTPAERAALMVRFAEELEKDVDAVTELLIAETGLTRRNSRGGALTMSAMLRYYAAIAGQIAWVTERKGASGVTASVEKVPLGVVAAIVPWNAPLALAAFKIPQALLAGCTVIVKPSADSPLSAGYLGDAALRAGLPPGVLNVIPANGEVSDYLVRHPGVDKIAFTGSTGVGRKIAAGAAATLKRLTLELGGKSAALVLDDAPLQRVVDTMVPAVSGNNGETCTIPSRLLVPEHRKDEIVGALKVAFEALRVGDPSDPAVEVGPMITKRHYDSVMGYLESARAEGGTIVTGGGRPAGLDTGYYVAPTIITDVSPGAKVAQEEIFAPVLTVLAYRDEDEAVAIANGTEFGLSGAVYSADPARALQVARRFRAGTVNINNGQLVDIGIPFGGFKQSGYGRELGPEGVDAYLETQAIFLDGEPLTVL